MTVFAAHMVVYFSTQLFTATLARMASTARCVRRTWRHSWRRRRSRLTPGLCYWTTTARATRTSAPPCTRGVRRRTALSLSLSWRGWERCFCLCQTAGEFMSVQSTHITKDWNTIAFLIVGKTAVWGIFHVTVISICRKIWLSSPFIPVSISMQCPLWYCHLGAPMTDFLKFYTGDIKRDYLKNLMLWLMFHWSVSDVNPTPICLQIINPKSLKWDTFFILLSSFNQLQILTVKTSDDFLNVRYFMQQW